MTNQCYWPLTVSSNAAVNAIGSQPIIGKTVADICADAANENSEDPAYWLENETEDSWGDLCFKAEDGVSIPTLYVEGIPSGISGLVAGQFPTIPDRRYKPTV